MRIAQFLKAWPNPSLNADVPRAGAAPAAAAWRLASIRWAPQIAASLSPLTKESYGCH